MRAIASVAPTCLLKGGSMARMLCFNTAPDVQAGALNAADGLSYTFTPCVSTHVHGIKDTTPSAAMNACCR